MGGVNTRTAKRPMASSSACAKDCIRKFLRFFPKGFQDEKYFAWERGYKERAHEQWEELLGKSRFASLLEAKKYREIADAAVRIESHTNLLFSFEKMALRDALKPPQGAKAFAIGLYALLYGAGSPMTKFESWIEVVGSLPRKQTRVLTWPVLTVFPFLAKPKEHFFLKPNVTRRAASEYGYELAYAPRPSWEIYSGLLRFAATVRKDLARLKPKDQIDIQSFLWVQGSDEYEE
jgi:hypothetical protein